MKRTKQLTAAELANARAAILSGWREAGRPAEAGWDTPEARRDILAYTWSKLTGQTKTAAARELDAAAAAEVTL